ncbi:MAG: hypothetical protein G8345_20350 [Magnetococcales bacterium]|nr:hypothetical protein [Magnetococcales bacterium]
MVENWNPKMVAHRMEEAASTLRALPGVRPKGYTSSWPPILQELMDTCGLAPGDLRPDSPTGDAITRMDESLDWLRWLVPEDARLVWLRAGNTPWKALMVKYGVSRTTVWSRWMAALLQIATHLNAGSGKKMFKHRV